MNRRVPAIETRGGIGHTIAGPEPAAHRMLTDGGLDHDQDADQTRRQAMHDARDALTGVDLPDREDEAVVNQLSIERTRLDGLLSQRHFTADDEETLMDIDAKLSIIADAAQSDTAKEAARDARQLLERTLAGDRDE